MRERKSALPFTGSADISEVAHASSDFRISNQGPVAIILHFAVTIGWSDFVVASAQRTDLIAVGTAHGTRIKDVPTTLKGSNRKDPLWPKPW